MPTSNKKIKVTTKVFAQSFVIDRLFAKRYLQEKYTLSTLDPPILYRGDTRGPLGEKGIFTIGFNRHIEVTGKLPMISENNATAYGISCTNHLVAAVGFADNSALAQMGHPKEEFSWVYVTFAEKGLKVYERPTNGTNLAGLVNEILMPGIPPEHIIAAFKIKTTNNKISDYIQTRAFFGDMLLANTTCILIVEFHININCSLKIENPALFQIACEKLKKHADKGYYKIPWVTPQTKLYNDELMKFDFMRSRNKSIFFRLKQTQKRIETASAEPKKKRRV